MPKHTPSAQLARLIILSKEAYTVPQTGKIIGRSTPYVWGLIFRGKIAGAKNEGGKMLIQRTDLAAYLRQILPTIPVQINDGGTLNTGEIPLNFVMIM